MNFPWFSDKSWRRLVCFFAAAVIWRIFLLFAFSDGWIGFFLAEIVYPFGWIWRFGRFSRPFSTHSLWFFHIGLKKVGLTLSLRDLCSESLVMHSLFIRQSFTQIGPLKPWNSNKIQFNMGKLIKKRKKLNLLDKWASRLFMKKTCNQLETLKVSWFRNFFFVSSIHPKNERKQFDLRYHSGKVNSFHSIFGRIEEDTKKIHFEITWPLERNSERFCTLLIKSCLYTSQYYFADWTLEKWGLSSFAFQSF